MKPTKEQLADPKWWDDSSNGYDYAFYLERLGQVKFADESGNSKDFGLIIGQDAWKLLAKRPETEWVHEVGDDCCGNTTDAAGNWSWQKVEPLKDMGNGEFACYTEKKILRFVDQFRPIKTQREEFMDKAMSIFKGDNMELYSVIAGTLYDAGCRFNLTEKDGN